MLSSFPEPPPDLSTASGDDFSLALLQRPEASRFNLQLRQNQIELDWARNQRVPGIDLQLAGSQDFGRPLRPRSSRDPAKSVDVPKDADGPSFRRYDSGLAKVTCREQPEGDRKSVV